MVGREVLLLSACLRLALAGPVPRCPSRIAGCDGGQTFLQRSFKPASILDPHLLQADIGEWDARAIAEARERWLVSGRRPDLAAPPSLESWPFQCREAKRVCFVENELVALDADAGKVSSAPPPAADAGGPSYWRAPDAEPLRWFAEVQVRYNLPGYFDGLRGVQSSVKPISVRAAARSMEASSLWEAPLLNVTPVIVYPMWPFNFGDSMGPFFLHSWIAWAARNPGMLGLPLAVAVPHSLQLPPFWKLLQSLGPGVESFSFLSRDYGTKPLCFERVVGCTAFALPSWRSHVSMGGGAAWEAFRAASVRQHCQLDAGAKDRGRLVVGLVQRQRGRQLLNMQGVLRQCNDLQPAAGKKIVCKAVQFSDIITDICPLQELDVIVGTHGAQLVNALFMRPGSSLVEVRANEWWRKDADGMLADTDSWPNTIAQKLWLTNSTLYWWYEAEARDSFPDGRSSVPGRDSAVNLSWPILSCMLQKVAAFRGGREEYARSREPLTHNAGCTDPAAGEV